MSNHFLFMRLISCRCWHKLAFSYYIGFVSNVLMYYSFDSPLWHPKFTTSLIFLGHHWWCFELFYKFQCHSSIWALWMVFFLIFVKHVSNSNWTLCTNNLAIFRKLLISKLVWFACMTAWNFIPGISMLSFKSYL